MRVNCVPMSVVEGVGVYFHKYIFMIMGVGIRIYSI
jgi:hypothetical protein